MIFELCLMSTVLVMAGMAFAHSWATRGRGDAILLLVLGAGFGYLFPVIDINLFEQYTFHGHLTVFNLPLHLGLAWYGLYVMSLALAEQVVGRDASRVRIAVLAGFIFGVLEAQWDPTLLHLGVMEVFLPSFAKWPLGFNPGLPMCHVYFGFAFVWAYLVLRGSPRPVLAAAAGLATLVIWPLGVMAMTPLVEPIYAWVGERLPQGPLMVLDTIHFATTFAPTALLAGLWLRWLGRRLGGQAAGA